MKKISLEFPDGSKKEFDSGVKGIDVVKSISEGLARNTYAMKLDEELVDINDQISKDAKIKFITWKDAEGKEVLKHSGAHVFAQALLRLFPNAKIAIGPAIETGFHYDFMLDRTVTPEDLPKLEEEMKKIVNEKLPIVKKEISKDEALKLFKDNKFKTEMISELDSGKIRVYEQGNFVDFCRGPHVPNTGMVKAFKLTKVSGAYWKGDARNEQLQRIYGIVFPDSKEMNEYLKFLEEAEKRDHRKITADLDMVYFHEYAPGAPFFLKKGTIVYNILIDFIRKQYRDRGYQEVITPQMYNKKLWEISGHWEHYRENMFIVKVEGQEHSLKPMNCPSHCLIFNRDVKSYKDMPIRIADFCNLHRNEFSGTLTGLVRVRKFAQDDGHIFCRFDQIEEEVLGVLEFIKYVWNDVFNFKLEYYLSTMPEKALGTKDLWDKAETLLKNALTKAGIPFKIKPGEGAFYGPKIDIDIEDALGRRWQCPTCQLDFNLPHRFETMYVDSESKKQEAVMIHRAVLGSLERFFGIMIEHYAGKLPLWLSPVQVKILPIADRHVDYCKKIAAMMKENDLRVEINARAETTSKKVREAQLEQVNYILVVGDKELENDTVNVRTREEKVLGEKKTEDFIKQLKEEVSKYK
jgi:threonyl-tRNA synthetase